MTTTTDVPVDTLSEEQLLAALKRRTEARLNANSTPLPGTVADAYAGRPPRIGKLQFRDVELDDFIILRQLNNPVEEFIPLALAGNLKNLNLTDAQLREVLYLWTRPSNEIDALMAKGPEAFKAKAHQLRIGLPLKDLPKVIEAVVLNLVRAFSTMVAHAPDVEDTSPFRNSPQGDPLTGSDGSLTCSEH